MKILITKDEHTRLGFRDKFRKPKWEEDMIHKHEFISQYMLDNGIHVKVTTGDIFDKQKGWSFSQYKENKKIFSIYKKNNQQVFTIAGNHDYLEGRTNISDSVFEEYMNLNLIQHIPSYGWGFGDTEIEANIYGIDYQEDKNSVVREINKIVSDKKFKEKPAVLVLHANVTPDPERVTEFTYEELSQYGFKAIICGHYHNGFETEEINGTIFINPWNLWRVVRDYSVQTGEHIPEFVVLDLQTWEYEHVMIPHKPYQEVFDLKEIDFYKKIKKETFSFFKSGGFSDLEDLKSDDDLESIAEVIIPKIKEEFNLNEEQLKFIINDLQKRFE